jgi:putative SOS response-associated peptidase YedK
MCGRYEAGQKQKIAEAFRVRVELDDGYFDADKECAPGSVQPVVYVKHGERRVGEMRWGFKFSDRLALNARADKLAVSAFWRERLGQRCLVPASSLLEWQKTGAGPRPKYRLSVKGRQVLGMAGLWGPWKNPATGEWEDTFVIITSDPNAKVSEIHDRQAVILEPREYAEWLEESERPPLHLLRTLPEEEMVIDPVLAVPKVEAQEPAQRGLFDAM